MRCQVLTLCKIGRRFAAITNIFCYAMMTLTVFLQFAWNIEAADQLLERKNPATGESR